MIKSVYNKYFQKSRAFLYPALGISKRNANSPIQTYLSWGEIKAEDRKLICVFANSPSTDFKNFQKQMLIKNPLYESSSVIGEHVVYVFDFSQFKDDWDHFLKGKYSKLSPGLKQAIKNYYGTSTEEYSYIDSYLYPDKYFSIYSKLLDEPVEIIQLIGELCNPYVLSAETLVLDLEVVENNL
jgi:hypothetical protein